jgi:hypothetical protein
MSPSELVSFPTFLDGLPEILRPYALEMFHTMRREPDLQQIDSADIAALICDEAFRSILVNYAIGRGARDALALWPQ